MKKKKINEGMVLVWNGKFAEWKAIHTDPIKQKRFERKEKLQKIDVCSKKK